jgi:hypothetical protein
VEEMNRRRRGREREIQWGKWEAPSELPSIAAPAECKRTPVWATESTYRNRIRKPRSGAAADALDLDWGRDEDERLNVLNLDGNA